REAGNRHEMSEKSVAVGLGCRDELRTDRACRPGPVFENDWLFEDCLQRGVERPGYRIADAAGRKRIDDSDGTRRIGVLGAGASWPQSACRCRRADEEAASVHAFPAP